MVAHSTPKAGVEWGTQGLGCRCRDDGSFLSRLASASGLLGMTKGGVAHPCGVVADGCVDRMRTIQRRVLWPSLRRDGNIR
jgi:hypothetical protein